MSHRATTILLAGLALGACAAPTEPTLAPSRTVIDTGVRTYTLHTQLRGIIDPDITPTPAWGHLHLALTSAGPSGYLAEWRGRLFNPDGETFSGGFIINPDIAPDPIDGDDEGSGTVSATALLTLFRGSVETCEVLILESSDAAPVNLTTEAVHALLGAPSGYRVIAISDRGGVVEGTLGIIDPEILVGFNPQPDPPGTPAGLHPQLDPPIARCAP